MATFTNQAALTYNGNAASSNITTGEQAVTPGVSTLAVTGNV